MLDNRYILTSGFFQMSEGLISCLQFKKSQINFKIITFFKTIEEQRSQRNQLKQNLRRDDGDFRDRKDTSMYSPPVNATVDNSMRS